MSDKEKRAEVEERLAEILDGDAPQEIYDAIAESDELRDVRHEAAHAADVAREAGADHVALGDLEARVLAALDARSAATETDSAQDPAAGDGKRAQLLADAAPSLGGPPTESDGDADAEPPDGEPVEDPHARPSDAGEDGAVGKVVSLASRRKVQIGLAATLSAAAAAAAVVLSLGGGETPTETAQAEAWSGTVDRVVTSKASDHALQVCNAQGEACQTASQGTQVPAGAVLRTDEGTRVRLQLNDGTALSLDRRTEVAFAEADTRRAKLARGAIVADVAHVEGSQARFDVPTGFVTVLGTKFALRATDDSTAVNVSRGAVRLTDEQERTVVVRAGEEGQLYAGVAPYASSAVALGEAIAWSDADTAAEDQEVVTRGLGELRAKKPGSQEEKKGAVTLTAHSVKVRISGAVARTEVDETFQNHTSDVLEGIYRFPMPPDAKIERLALEVDGKLEEGAFVDRDRASSIWRGAIVQAAPKMRRQMQDEIIWVPGPWKDPALLEWQRGGRFELRIYPIPKNGSRRVVLTYTQVIRPTGGVRRYTYPMAHDPSGSTRVDNFAVDVAVRGHDRSFGVRTHGWEPSHDGSSPEAEKLHLAKQAFAPSGDLTVEYALPDRHAELTAWAYQPTPAATDAKPAAADAKPAADDAKPVADDSSAFVALTLRPRLPRVAADQHRAFVVVVDSSRSMFGESYRRATQLASRVVREMDRLDTFTVLACDTSCRALPGGLRPPSRQAADETTRFLEGLQPEGGSDVTEMVRSAKSAASGGSGRELRLVYIGDGTPTVGPISPAYVTQAVRSALPAGSGTVTAVAIGSDSDLDTLSAVARGGGGVVLPYVPGQTTPEAAYAVLGAAYGSSLQDVTVTLPEGLTEVAPRRVDTIPAGGESIIVARMNRASVEGTVTVKGKVGGKDFEQRYPVKLASTTAAGNAFVPRLYAATRIADLEQRADAESRKEAIALSGRFNVASRHTSLLVLESPAMFKAFGLDNTRRTPTWTGEEDTESTVAEGEFEMDDGELAASALDSVAGGGLGLSGVGSGAGGLRLGGGSSAARPKPRKKSAPDMDFGPPAPAAPAPPASRPPPRMEERADDAFEMMPPPRPRPRPRRMIPMRRVWDRKGSVATDKTAPKAATSSAISEAEREHERNPNRREAVKQLYVLYALAGDVDKARPLADRWSEAEPLDPDALTARADLAARNGDRDLAIRILGSVVDVRPGDVKSQKRLARLHRWAGRPAVGCRHSIAIAQLRSKDSKLLAEAVICGRKTHHTGMVDDMLSGAEEKVRKAAEALIAKAKDDDGKLRGDLQLEATWSGSGHDLDLGLLHPDGHRVSWLGAPTRSVITATDVESMNREGLALRGAKPGEYVVEIVRARGSGPVSGSVTVTIAGTKRSIPFTLQGDRLTLAVAKLRMESRLVPARGW